MATFFMISISDLSKQSVVITSATETFLIDYTNCQHLLYKPTTLITRWRSVETRHFMRIRLSSTKPIPTVSWCRWPSGRKVIRTSPRCRWGLLFEDDFELEYKGNEKTIPSVEGNMIKQITGNQTNSDITIYRNLQRNLRWTTILALSKRPRQMGRPIISGPNRPKKYERSLRTIWSGPERQPVRKRLL